MGNQQFNVKAFKVPNLINRIVYQYFRSPKSARSYHYARKFIILGIQTPTPVGHVECSENGLFSKSFYVSLHLNYNYTLKEVLDFPDKQKKDILRKWIHFTYEKLHKNGIFHLDYSPGNTLITENNGEYQFSIVDLNRLSFRKINFEYGLRNFSRLGVDQAIFEFVGSEYAMIRGQNPEKGAHLMVEIDRKCNKKLEKKDLLKEILKWVLRYGRDEKLAS
jgi:serine/threonine protein kinase